MTGFKSKRAMGDSRFAVMYEDPDYEDWADNQEQDIMDWLNSKIDEPVVKKQQEDFSPFITMNS